MAFAPTLAELVRTSSGILWAGLGLALLLFSRRSSEARLFGGFLALLVADLVGTNVAGMLDPPSPAAHDLARGVAAACNTAGAALLVLYLRSEARSGHATARRALALGVACGVAAATIRLAFVENPVVISLRTASLLILFGLIGSVSWHLAERGIQSGARSPLTFLCAIAVYPLAYALEEYVPEGTLPHLTSAILTVLPSLLAIVALFRARSSQGPVAPLLGSIMLGAGALALALRVSTDGSFDVRGPARLVAFGFLIAGVVALGWLGKVSPRSGTALVTGVGLPALFIVAQVVENFLDTRYGLLMGGVVAGALLVAARPIERALERRHTGIDAPRAPAAAGDARERSFRAAVRKFHKDGVISREEERELMILAEHLGIPPSRAYALRDEVERADP